MTIRSRLESSHPKAFSVFLLIALTLGIRIDSWISVSEKFDTVEDH
ncbi:MAG TPA: hypothetical protein VEO96_04860 [Thermoplasmata archaeon]|nr:hypothetical protein [Thermoplasmata archaeon]